MESSHGSSPASHHANEENQEEIREPRRYTDREEKQPRPQEGPNRNLLEFLQRFVNFCQQVSQKML